MLDFIHSKFGLFLIILFFGTSVSYLGIKDLQRINAKQFSVAPLNESFLNDNMIQVLHGDVNLGQRASLRKLRKQESAIRRARSYDGFKEYIENVVPQRIRAILRLIRMNYLMMVVSISTANIENIHVGKREYKLSIQKCKIALDNTSQPFTFQRTSA